MKKETKLDITEYLRKIVTIDYFILNEDRHLNNICFLFNEKNNTYSLSPIFDNGLGLLADTNDYSFHSPTQTNMKKVKARPFSTDFKKQIKYFDNYSKDKLKINYNELMDELNNVIIKEKEDEFNRAKNVLIMQLKRSEGELWERI